MAGGGYYPTMMDCEWRIAPWNVEDPQMQVCAYCGGDGGVWYDEKNGRAYTKADCERLSEEEQSELEFHECEECNGKGEIEIEPYEPDYDDYDN